MGCTDSYEFVYSCILNDKDSMEITSIIYCPLKIFEHLQN